MKVVLFVIWSELCRSMNLMYVLCPVRERGGNGLHQSLANDMCIAIARLFLYCIIGSLLVYDALLSWFISLAV